MNDRSDYLLSIRPEIPSAKVTENMSDDEKFQNGVLRPIIKFQNPLIIAMFSNYITKFKNAFYHLSAQKRLDYIENAVQKNMKFRNSLKGIIIGQFALEEYETYIKNSSALNKRMMTMVIERLKDQVQVFEESALV
ncbi:MAG TPA: glyoxalase [Pricia antarctica]|uniref:Glyoxalase n=1 Tax=Pricia antarctica TaxID=641691 RepID=A0A831QUD8_9FLAO|nr:glyoxalase [Pricia antarctica]